MIVKDIVIHEYECEKCGTTYKEKDVCKSHEKSCTYSHLDSIITHDGKHTKTSRVMDCFEFFRMCSVQYDYSMNHHVWLYVNRQHSIRPKEYKYSGNNNWSQSDKASKLLYEKQHKITNQLFFEFDETGEKRENFVFFKTKNLQKCKCTVTYEDGHKVVYDHNSELQEVHAIVLYKNNKVVKVELEDVFIKPEMLSFEATGNRCITICKYKPRFGIGSHACKYECPNFVGNAGDYIGPVACNFKTNNESST